MKYTTIIDITEVPAVYRNINARLLYVHMALKSGYHTEDRDVLDMSIRNLSVSAGLTFSATRHALRLLEASKLIKRQGDVWIVKKWLPAQTIAQRPNLTEEQLESAEKLKKAREHEEQKEQQDREKAMEAAAQGKTQFMLYYEGLQRKADEGDLEAKQLVKKHEATYRAHEAQMAEKMKNEKSEAK